VGSTTAGWLGFGGALAAVSGALTGLLFVALPVGAAALAASRGRCCRAAQTLVLFLVSVLIAVLVVAPQPPGARGAGLLAVAAVCGAALVLLDRRAGHRTAPGVARSIEGFSPEHDLRRAGRRGRAHLRAEAGGGLSGLIPAAVASLPGGVISAWLFLVTVTS
jgi:hypothetical protein